MIRVWLLLRAGSWNSRISPLVLPASNRNRTACGGLSGLVNALLKIAYKEVGNTMNMKTTRVLAVLLMGLTMLSGFAVAQDQIVAATTKETDANAASSTDKSFPERHPRYKLQAGDAFDLSFELNPEFNQTVTVQPDGYITLRAVGDVQVKGQTVPELTATLKGAYSGILNNPLISVVLKDFEKPYFIADGQVGQSRKV